MARKKTKPRPLKLRRMVPRYRNKILNAELDAAYHHFCGVGLHRIKVALSKRAATEPRAAAYLLAIEIEAASRRAKRRTGDHQQQLYQEKRKKIRELLRLCVQEGYRTEIETAPDSGQAHVVYVYLPGCEQLSWHTSLDASHPQVAPQARGWDGQKYSALRKLEAAIRKAFPEVLK